MGHLCALQIHVDMLAAKPDPLNISESLHQELSIPLYTIPQLQTTLLSPILFFVSCKGKSAYNVYNCIHDSFVVDFMEVLYTSSDHQDYFLQHFCHKISFVFAYDTEIGGKELYDVVACSMSALFLNSQVSFLCPKVQFHVVIKTAFLIILDSSWCIEARILFT